MKNIVYISIILTAVLTFGCGTKESLQTELPAIAVKIQKAEAHQISEVIAVSGHLEASSSANLSTRMMGHVTLLKVKTGDKVKMGQRLLSISSADLQAKQGQVEAGIRQAESALSNAATDLKRFEALFASGSASQKELDNMTTRYEMAKFGVESAQQMKREVDAQFAYLSIEAPFDGIIINTFVKEGDMANPGMPLVSIEGAGKLEGILLVPEAYIQKVNAGMAAKVHVKSAGRVIDGIVTEVSNSAKNTGGQYLVKVQLSSSDKVYSGMFVSAELLVETGNDGMVTSPVVSKAALIQSGQLTGLYTVGTNGTAVLRWVRIGKEIGDKVEILSGLQSGEDYVLEPQGRLFNGARLKF